MPTATYIYYDENGEERSIVEVLDPVALTGVGTTSGSNLITVASTSGVYPGMAMACPNIPPGAFVHAVKSATVLELAASAFNRSTGVWSTTGANANATASDSGLLARALGFCPFTIVELAHAMGMWRNLHSAATNNGLGFFGSLLDESVASTPYGRGVAMVPNAGSFTSGEYKASGADFRVSDALAATPLKRHNGELWGVYLFVSTAGHLSRVPATPGREILYAGATAA